MTAKLVKSATNDGQITKSELSDGSGEKLLPSVAEFSYNWLQFEDYLGNVGLTAIAHARSGVDHLKPILSGLFVLALVLQSSLSWALTDEDRRERDAQIENTFNRGVQMSDQKATFCARAALATHSRCLNDIEPILRELRKIPDILQRIEQIGDQIEGCTKVSELERSRCEQN